jgi:hypothetical protein
MHPYCSNVTTLVLYLQNKIHLKDGGTHMNHTYSKPLVNTCLHKLYTDICAPNNLEKLWKMLEKKRIYNLDLQHHIILKNTSTQDLAAFRKTSPSLWCICSGNPRVQHGYSNYPLNSGKRMLNVN